MKNRKNLYFLIPLNVLIWGYIGYKIYHVTNDDKGMNTKMETFNNESEISIKDSFVLVANYRDPFLGLTVSKRMSEVPRFSASNKNNLIKPIIVENRKPELKYLGIIKNNKSKKQIILLSINGSIGNYSKGDKIGELQILNIFNDSIQIKFHNERYFVKK